MVLSGIVILFVLSALGLADAAQKLPDYIPQACALADPKLNECIVKTGRAAIPFIINGDRKYRVPNLNPMFITELTVQQGTDQVGLKLVWKNASMIGLKDIDFYGCDIDVVKRHTVLRLRVPSIQIVGKYNANGRVLLLPVTGNGIGNLTLFGVDTKFSYDWPNIKKSDGREYIDIQNATLDYKLKGMYIHFDNLFNGDKLLGNHLNGFLNENWRELDKEVGPSLAAAIGEVFRLVLKNICDVVPYDVVFKI